MNIDFRPAEGAPLMDAPPPMAAWAKVVAAAVVIAVVATVVIATLTDDEQVASTRIERQAPRMVEPSSG